MAHEIQILENGDACFVECTHYGEIAPAWHGLGQRFDEPMTIEFAMQQAHADFTVSKQPIIGLTPEIVELINNGQSIDGETLKSLIIDGSTCNMRNDNNQVVAITSDTYGLIQNIDAFRFLDNICGVTEDKPVVDTMGVLSDGTTFASIRMKNVYDLGKGDDVDMYLIVKNSFNNKESMSVFTSFTRCVCRNTLNAAFKGAQSKMFIKHTRYANDRLMAIDDAARTLKFYDIYKEAFVANMENLKKIRISDKNAEKIICRTLMADDVYKIYKDSNYNRNCEDLSTRTRNSIDNALNVLENGIGQRECADKGTGLWLYNGITTLYNNHTNFKTQEKKFNSIFGGMADERQQKVFDLILANAA